MQVITAFLSELRIDGHRITCEEICLFFQNISDKEAEDLLRHLYLDIGRDVFVFYVQGLVYKVLLKYLAKWELSEEEMRDILSECFCSILEGLERYEGGKGRLMSYVYTSVRGVVTKYLYCRQKGVYHNMEYSDVLFYRNREFDGYELVEDNDIESDEDEIELKVKIWGKVKERMFGRMVMN